MAERATRIAAWVLLGVCLIGCASGGAARPSPSRAATMSRLAELETSGKPAEMLAFVDATLPSERSSSMRARLELARARALRDDGRHWSAFSSFHAAQSELRADPDTSLLATVLAEWADLQTATGRPADAVARYTEALALPRLDRSLQRRLQASLVVATREAGDRAASKAWLSALGVGGDREVATVERRLAAQGLRAPEVAADAPRAVPGGGIPTDPRRLHQGTHRRAEWGARPIGSNSVPMKPITSITVHHSAMETPGIGDTRVARQIKGIQSYHVDTRGWADIGYHFLIDPQGEVWEGRALSWQGAHAGGDANIGNVGVCLLGDFERSASVPRLQLAALAQLLDELRDYFSIPASRVHTHREWVPSTECPGDILHQAVLAYRTSARDTVARQ